MFDTLTIAATDKPTFYGELHQQLAGLLNGETDPIANAANTSALLYQHVPNVNWAGFYFLRSGELVLGPFQGKPACVRIPVGKGVCGIAVAEARSMLVEDVHAFPGTSPATWPRARSWSCRFGAARPSLASLTSTALLQGGSTRKTRRGWSAWQPYTSRPGDIRRGLNQAHVDRGGTPWR